MLGSLLPGLQPVASVVQTSSVTSSVCSDAGVAVACDSVELFVTLEGFGEVSVAIVLVVILLEVGP